MTRLALLAAALLTACGGTDAEPCAGIDGTCVAVHVSSSAATSFTRLHLDVVWDGQHGRTAVDLEPGTTLPAATALTFPDPPAAPARLDVVAGVADDATILATGHGTTTLVPGATAEVRIALTPPPPCDTTRTYCGGVALAGDPDTVYACTATIPDAHGRCPGDCIPHPTLGDTCAGVGGRCVTGGRYCGGDKLDGDPSTLYECSASGTAINPTFCTDGCVVAPAGSDDFCR